MPANAERIFSFEFFPPATAEGAAKLAAAMFKSEGTVESAPDPESTDSSEDLNRLMRSALDNLNSPKKP